MVRCYIFLAVVLLGGSVNADSPGRFARRLASAGSLFHDQSAGRENIFYSSNAAFPRRQARVAWRKSPGHAANLPMIGLRVSRGPNGVYVVGRR